MLQRTRLKMNHPIHSMLQFSKCFDRSRNNKCIVNLSGVKLETLKFVNFNLRKRKLISTVFIVIRFCLKLYVIS